MLTCFKEAGFDEWFLDEQQELFMERELQDKDEDFFAEAVQIMKLMLGKYFVEKIQTWYDETGRNDVFECLDMPDPQERNEVLRISCGICGDWFSSRYGQMYFGE